MVLNTYRVLRGLADRDKHEVARQLTERCAARSSDADQQIIGSFPPVCLDIEILGLCQLAASGGLHVNLSGFPVLQESLTIVPWLRPTSTR
jgi:hypothetical protein